MPDLKNRSEHEKKIAVLMLLLFNDEEANILGGGKFNPNDFINRAGAALEPPLRDVYRQAGEGLLRQYKVDRALGRERQWAEKYSKSLARELAKTTRDRLSELDPDSEEFQAELAAIFTAQRADSIGVTETTRSITMGEGDAVGIIREETGRVLIPTWYTSLLDNVCPVCEPLHETTPRVWRRRFPEGPPAHPGCNCNLEYE